MLTKTRVTRPIQSSAFTFNKHNTKGRPTQLNFEFSKMNKIHRINSPRSRRALQVHRPMPNLPNRRLASVSVRHNPRRMTSKTGIHAVDAATQRGNIQVVVRIRPMNSAEGVPAYRTVVQAVNTDMILFDAKEVVNDFYYHGKRQQNYGFKPNKDAKFVFDSVFNPASTNQEIFASTIQRSLDALIDGFNCSVFAYGATGSGKTFTMLGSGNENPGLTLLTLKDLYDRLKDLESEFETSVSVSYLEVYNESVRDLLNPGGNGRVLNIVEDENGVSVPHITTVQPRNQSDLLKLLSEGNNRRTQHPTDHNAESSRSHAVFQVHVMLRARYTEMNKNIRSAKLVMVDLAGSERGSATGFNGIRFLEGACINKSLLALGNCINALADGKKHVPYRDSKLTRLLKDSLGGNCKTIIIANVSPSSLSYDDTYNTLKYANRAKQIRCDVKKNEMRVTVRLEEYAKIMQEMQTRIKGLITENEEYKSSCTCHLNKVSASDDFVTDKSDDESKENEINSDPSVDCDGDVMKFKNLKRRYSETLGHLRATETLIQLKKSRLKLIEQPTDAGATKGVERRKKLLKQLEEKYNNLSEKSRCEKLECDHALDDVTEEIVPVSKAELLRLKSLETEIELLMATRNEEKDIVLQDHYEVEKLLVSTMAAYKKVYQVAHFHQHTTMEQDADYEVLRKDYLGQPKKVRWADQKSAMLLTGTPTQHNTTYTYKE